MRTHVSNDGRFQSTERASRTSSLRCRMLGGALLAMVLSEGAQAAYPLQGKWRCTAPAIHVPAHAGVPAGTLHQRTAYAADAEGHWNSNSVIDYVGNRALARFWSWHCAASRCSWAASSWSRAAWLWRALELRVACMGVAFQG